MFRLRHILGAFLLTAALAASAVPARADQDAVQFFRNIDVAADQPVHDAVCFFCNVHVDGVVTGDVVVFFGSAHISGEARHDVVTFFGSVIAGDSTRIDHDVVSFFGSVRLGEDASVGHDLVSIFGAIHAPQSATVSGERVSFSSLIFYGPMLLIVLVLVVVLRELRAGRRRRAFAQGYPFPPQR